MNWSFPIVFEISIVFSLRLIIRRMKSRLPSSTRKTCVMRKTLQRRMTRTIMKIRKFKGRAGF
jgi:hypothetical protein